MEAWTALFAQVVLGTFDLSTRGEAHLNEALGKLRSFGSAGDLMYFGFGVKHIVRTLAESREGMTTVAICAAIAEVHSPHLSTLIIQEYAKLYATGAPGNLVPSYRQWEALVKSCSGVLAQSPFGLVFEFFKRFNPEMDQSKDQCGEPKQVAHALDGLAKISSGLMKSMVLQGNSECAFLAAIAQWLFDLRVVVQDRYGKIVYPSVGADVDSYQLMIIFSDDMETSKSVTRAGGTYYIERFDEVISDGDDHMYLNGRVEWGTALRHTFGSFATKLLQMPTILGALFGGAAKIYEMDGRETSTSNQLGLQRGFARFGPEASGRAFIDLAYRTLPELAFCRDSMDKAFEESDDAAFLNFKKSSAQLKEVCGCDDVCFGFGEASDTYSSHGECLVLVAHTAIQLVRQVSTIASIPADLRPSRGGLEGLYKLLRERQRESGQDIINLLHALHDIDLLDLASIVFNFRQQYDSRGMSAEKSVLSSGGTCFVLDGVLNLSSRAEEALRVHIIPGHIEWDGKIYEQVRDGQPRGSGDVIPPMILPAAKARFEAQMQVIASMTTRALVSESYDGLRMSYEVKSISGYYTLGPRDIYDLITERSNNTSCFGKICPPYDGLRQDFLFTLCDQKLPYASSRGVMEPLGVPEKPNIMLLGGNHVARGMALQKCDFSGLILQNGECIACCARRAMDADEPSESIIISHLTVEGVERLMESPNSLVYDA